jgi:hypothetical protein
MRKAQEGSFQSARTTNHDKGSARMREAQEESMHQQGPPPIMRKDQQDGKGSSRMKKDQQG